MVLPLLGAIAPFAPIIGGAIGALGSWFAPKPKAGLDLGQLRKDAEKNGFNPLTVLRAAGGSYGRVSDTRVSDALMTFGSGVANFQYDPYGEAKSLAELRLAEAQIASYAEQGKAPANLSFSTPSASGVATGVGVVNAPLTRTGVGAPQEAPGAISDIGWVRTQSGWTVVPSTDAKERIEDDIFQQGLWFFRNIASPQLGFSLPPFPSFLGDERNYRWNSFANEWQPRPGTVPNIGGSF